MRVGKFTGKKRRSLRIQTQGSPVTIGVREGILLGGGRKKFVLKVNFLVQSEWVLKRLVNLFYTVQFVCNGFVYNVNSPIKSHFVRPRWHLLHPFQFAYNVISATTFFMQSSRGAVRQIL